MVNPGSFSGTAEPRREARLRSAVTMRFVMSIVEKRSAARDVDPLAEGGEMSPVTSICVGLVLALAIYALGSAILLRDPDATVSAEQSPDRDVIRRSLSRPGFASVARRRLAGSSQVRKENSSKGDCDMTRIEKLAEFDSDYAHAAAPRADHQDLGSGGRLTGLRRRVRTPLSHCRKQRGEERLRGQRPGAAAIRRPLNPRRAAARAEDRSRSYLSAPSRSA